MFLDLFDVMMRYDVIEDFEVDVVLIVVVELFLC